MAFRNSKSSSIYDARPKGFACGYAQKRVGDDKASVRQLLFSDINLANNLSEVDDVLARKIAVVKRELQDWSNGQINEQYWHDLAAGKVNFAYWGLKEGGSTGLKNFELTFIYEYLY